MINPRENNENTALIIGNNNGPSSVPLLENSSTAWMVELPLLMLVITSTSMTTGNKTVVERPVTTKICWTKATTVGRKRMVRRSSSCGLTKLFVAGARTNAVGFNA
jgi:hypothetical protein